MSDFGLPQRTTDTMHAIFAKHSGVKKVTIYGSRAMGNYRNGSDIDLTMFGDALGYEDVSQIVGELDDSDIPYLVDLSIFDQLDDAEFKDHIRRRGKVFYDRHAGWRTVKLGDVCKFIRGLTYSKKDETAHSQTAVLRATNVDLSTYSLTFDQIRYISDDVKIKDEKYAKAGDILMCTASGSKSHLGKVALVTKDTGMAFGGFMAALRTSESCLSSYLYLVLISPQFSTHLTTVSDGANINNLKFSQISNFELSLPPLPQQQRIVAKLDAVFAEIDGAIAAAEKKSTETEKLKASILSQQLDARSQGGSGVWETVRLGNVCEMITKGTTPTSIGFKFENEGINFIKVESLANDSTFIAGKFAHINNECNEALKRSQLREEDILFSIAGALGRTAIVTKDILPANTNQALAILRLNPNISVDKRFLLYALSSDAVKAQSNAMKGGVAQQNLSLTQLKSYGLSLPPLPEQQRIVAKLDAAFKETDRMRHATTKQVANYHALKSALLAQELQNEVV